MKKNNEKVVREALRTLKTYKTGLKKHKLSLMLGYNLARAVGGVFKGILKIYPNNHFSYVRLMGIVEFEKNIEQMRHQIDCLIQRMRDSEVIIKELSLDSVEIELEVKVHTILSKLVNDGYELLEELESGEYLGVTSISSYES